MAIHEFRHCTVFASNSFREIGVLVQLHLLIFTEFWEKCKVSTKFFLRIWKSKKSQKFGPNAVLNKKIQNGPPLLGPLWILSFPVSTNAVWIDRLNYWSFELIVWTIGRLNSTVRGTTWSSSVQTTLFHAHLNSSFEHK